jgi:Fur family ferric uptake transcriptional regulator
MKTSDQPADDGHSAAGMLRSRRIKITPPRLVILRAARQFTQPFRAEQLLERAKASDRAISQATVYRFLTLLLKHEIVRQVDLPQDPCRHFEINRQTEFAVGHLICHDCRQVIEVADPCLNLRERLVAGNLGFTPTKLDLRIEADCRELHEKGRCSRLPATPPDQG